MKTQKVWTEALSPDSLSLGGESNWLAQTFSGWFHPLFLFSSLISARRFRREVRVHRFRCESVNRVGMFSRLVSPFFMALSLLSGCGKTAPPPVDRTAIEDVASWHQSYVAAHGRKLPPDEAAFVGFVEAKMKERGQEFDPATFLVSPRDGQKYVVKYGKELATLGGDSVVVHEKEGSGGKVLVGYQMGRSAEIDLAELPALTAAKP